MFRYLAKLSGMAVFIAAGAAGIWYYQDRFSAQHQIQQLEEKNKVLAAVVQRLGDENRVAEVLVTDQTRAGAQLKTTLLLVEYDKLGNALPPKSFTIEGNEAHVDALVIRFNQDFVEKADPLRGHSIALFTRVYGNQQKPDDGTPIDPPGKIPDIYRGSDPRVGPFEQELWTDFWKLADDAGYRARHGVEVATGQGVWSIVQPDRLYTITLQAHGGVSIVSEPLRGIYRAALHHGGSAATQP